MLAITSATMSAAADASALSRTSSSQNTPRNRAASPRSRVAACSLSMTKFIMVSAECSGFAGRREVRRASAPASSVPVAEARVSVSSNVI